MDTIIERVKAHCLDLLNNSRCKILPFHNIQHTLDVFENVQIIGEFEGIDENQMEILKIAALFHDTGVSETYNGHEDISTNNAILFLHKINYSENRIEHVVNCINATKMPQHPNYELERIMCDADLFHLSSPEYFAKNLLLRKEWSQYLSLDFTDEQWETMNLNFFKTHEYKTTYGKQVLAQRKLVNMAKMEAMCQ